MPPLRILLASASPRRREILTLLGHDVTVAPVDIDETERPNEPADAYLCRIVDDKLSAARIRLAATDRDAVLVADTTVSLDGVLLHKPIDAPDNAAMIRRMSDRGHVVTTRFAIAGRDGATHVESVATRVVLRAVSDDEIAAYVATREGLDKAGGYALQGRAAAFITKIDGSYGAVVGLPHCEVSVALARLVQPRI